MERVKLIWRPFNFQQGGFIGHKALLEQKERGIKKKLVQFLVEDHDVELDPWPWGGEPIFRNGVYAGKNYFLFTLNIFNNGTDSCDGPLKHQTSFM